MKTLVAGWFSFRDGHATAGDLLTRDLACEWLEQAGYPYDVAVAPPFEPGIDLERVNPREYSQLLFVCGPFQQGELEARLLDRFSHCRLLGLNLSMDLPLEEWNPFDFLVERDSSAGANADIVFLAKSGRVPVVGICLVEDYPGAMVERANSIIRQYAATRSMAVVSVDTRLDCNSTGFRNPAEIESLIARMDVLITTRLHGMVLALKNGVPVIAIDPVAGGAKIQRQARTIGWPMVFNADTVTKDDLRRAMDSCLSDRARHEARACAERAARMVEGIRDAFVAALKHPEALEQSFRKRMAAPVDTRWMEPYIQRGEALKAKPGRRQRRSLLERILGKSGGGT